MAEIKVEGSVIAQAGREAFFQSLGKPLPAASELAGTRWEAAAAAVRRICADDEFEMKFVDLAKAAHAAYFGLADGDKWQAEPKIIKLAWEAAARAMLNFVDVEDDEALKETVESARRHDWKAWTLKKLEQQ